ncbi:1484_t:CDS:2 [Diversispora eburnea]|uniref:1484_t:CDS:1 n=1 Tax=Diversispora eburnea TaxID=1213867 RepID=A0A9N9D1D7_9GLOM|nr:1484_t:CDS:2 [Diversispora eburnea]
MSEEIQIYFDKLLLRIDGLKVITVTDRDGVILIKSELKDFSDRVFEPTLSTTFSVVNDQASKLGLKKNKFIISVYENHQVVHFNNAPLIITLVADSTANTGMLLNLGDELKDVTDVIASALSGHQDIP